MYKYSIFEYKEFASCNFLGGDTNSFEIKITDSSELNLSYTKVNFNDEILEYKLYSLPLRCIDEIKEVIKKNQEIFDINSSLNNGSLDGSGQTFWFSTEKKNREITAWNIDYSIDDGHTIRKEYLDEYGDNLRQERTVLNLFFEICKILKKENIILELYKFKGNKKIEYKLDK